MIANHDSEWHCPAIQWPVTNGSSWSDAMPCKARSMTGPCWALLQGMISSSKARQGPVIDWALPGFAGRSSRTGDWAIAGLRRYIDLLFRETLQLVQVIIIIFELLSATGSMLIKS